MAGMMVRVALRSQTWNGSVKAAAQISTHFLNPTETFLWAPGLRPSPGAISAVCSEHPSVGLPLPPPLPPATTCEKELWQPGDPRYFLAGEGYCAGQRML